MHQKRTSTSRRLPIPRKGTKYVARAGSHLKDGLPVVIAVRDVLKLAKNSREVRNLVRNKLIKVNGKEVKKIRETVRLMNIIECGKKYKLSVLPTGKFSLEETKEDFRLCKVTGRKLLRGNKIQLNMHDGTNVISEDKIRVGDSIELGFDGKIKKAIPLEKGKEFFVISGKSIGLTGKIQDVDGKKVRVKFRDIDKEVELDEGHIIVR